VLKVLIGDVTCGLARPLAPEIDKSTFIDCSRKGRITCEEYTKDMKLVLNTN
jgi:hypothetical protein